MNMGGYPPGVSHGDQFAPWNRDEKRCEICGEPVENTYATKTRGEVCSECVAYRLEIFLEDHFTVEVDEYDENELRIKVKRTD
jgi:ribosome-binding protein aMBF1 (putative translation factor)